MNDIAVPLQQSDLTPGWLTGVLRHGGVIAHAQVVAAESEPIGAGAGFVGDIARVRLSYDGVEAGAPATLVAKLPTLEPRRRLMSTGARLFEREIKFYDDIAAWLDVRTPRRYFSASDPIEGRHVLLLEDLAPARTGDQVAGCSPAEAELAVRHIARLHAAWWQDERLASLDWMPELAGVHPSAEAWWDQMWGPSVARAGGRLPASVLRIGERLGANAMYALRRLDAGPHTIVHGDFRLDNLFFGAAAGGDPMAVVDWQLSTRGCGVYDVAYLLSGGLAPGDRKAHEVRLLRAWHEELIARGVRGYSFDDAWYGYRLSAMVCLTFITVMLNVIESAEPRAAQLVDVVIERAAAAVDELNVEELLPG